MSNSERVPFNEFEAVIDSETRTVDLWYYQHHVKRGWVEVTADEIDAMIMVLQRAKREFAGGIPESRT